MKRYLIITEYAYLFIALFLTEETIRKWGQQDATPFLYIALAVMGYFMFFFRRWHRRKLEGENRDK